MIQHKWRSRLAVVAAAALILAGCGMRLDAARKTEPPAGPFVRELHQGYLALSQIEYDEADYRDSDVFARRVMTLSQGGMVDPEAIEARPLPEDKVGELAGARQRLVGALDQTARTKVPDAAARAQTMFDCWMEEQELAENFQPDDIALCRSGFEAAMAEVENAMRPPPPPPPPAAAAQPAMPAPMEEPTRNYTLFFDFDVSRVDNLGQRVIEAVVADWGGKNVRINLVGHTDASGPTAYNQALSERRVDSVAAALRAAGLSGTGMSGVGRGETDLAVPTPDGVREPRNRRVVITIMNN